MLCIQKLPGDLSLVGDEQRQRHEKLHTRTAALDKQAADEANLDEIDLGFMETPKVEKFLTLSERVKLAADNYSGDDDDDKTPVVS